MTSGVNFITSKGLLEDPLQFNSVGQQTVRNMISNNTMIGGMDDATRAYRSTMAFKSAKIAVKNGERSIAPQTVNVAHAA